jgi:hypothetical protein
MQSKRNPYDVLAEEVRAGVPGAEAAFRTEFPRQAQLIVRHALHGGDPRAPLVHKVLSWASELGHGAEPRQLAARPGFVERLAHLLCETMLAGLLRGRAPQPAAETVLA